MLAERDWRVGSDPEHTHKQRVGGLLVPELEKWGEGILRAIWMTRLAKLESWVSVERLCLNI